MSAGVGAQDCAIRFEDAGKCFGDRWVLEHVDLGVPRGSIYGLIGPSGCGKTTAVRLANGVYRPDAGRVEMLGRPASRLHARERAAIGYLPQQPALFASLSLWENLNFHASVNGVRFRRRRRLREVLDLVDLGEHAGKKVSEASGGMRRRLALAATLVHQPSVLLLDEPTAGIDPILRRRFWEHFRMLAAAGHTLVVTTQYIGEAADCDLVGLLAEGGLAAAGTPADLQREAVGGELVEVETNTVVDDAAAADVARDVGARSYEHRGPRQLRFVVDDAGVALPVIVQQLEQRGVGAAHVEEVVPPFDDVFISLVAAARETTS
jgi:ABC-2 type transport system ATP-binding protein